MTDPELLSLVRQGQRWAIAARQDRDPVVQHVHWNYAHVHFELAHHGASRARIRQLTGVDIDAALAEVAAAQQRVQLQLLTATGSPAWR
ncbi:MAG: hypothetical protein Q8Q14_08560 [Gemmatimonadales bacterium]|nr:hypothetical protein [Gemmatimonadales bacterium]